MKVELCINKERVPYVVEEFGDRVTVTPYNEDSDVITFEYEGQIDILKMFHAGIRHGSDSMRKALLSK